MTIFEFIDCFGHQDLFDYDKRSILEKCEIALAREVFEGLYNEDLSEVIDQVNYYEVVREKLNTPLDIMESLINDN